MKRYMFNTLLLALTAVFTGCGGGSDDPQPAAPTITVSQESINAPAEGGSYTINVTTTGKEWGVYADGDFVKATAQYANNAVAVTIDENPNTTERTGNVTIMSGTARKNITVTQAAAAKPAYNAPDGYTLVWQDEFEGTSNQLNAADWTHEVKNSGWVNHELQNYVNQKTPEGQLVTEVKNGTLRITARKENGKVYSKGKGTWPAFWMMPVNFKSWPADGEIDIMEEVGYHPNYVSSSLHANAHVHSNNTQVTHEMKCDGAEGEFHTYAILWTAKNITTYVDGKVQLSYDNRGLGRDDWPYDDPFYVILNLAWGGDWGGMKGVDESALPITMKVDYVRVFQKK